jgi:hypothetical protein
MSCNTKQQAEQLTSVQNSFTFSSTMLQWRSKAFTRPNSFLLFLQLISTCGVQRQAGVIRAAVMMVVGGRPGVQWGPLSHTGGPCIMLRAACTPRQACFCRHRRAAGRLACEFVLTELVSTERGPVRNKSSSFASNSSTVGLGGVTVVMVMYGTRCASDGTLSRAIGPRFPYDVPAVHSCGAANSHIQPLGTIASAQHIGQGLFQQPTSCIVVDGAVRLVTACIAHWPLSLDSSMDEALDAVLELGASASATEKTAAWADLAAAARSGRQLARVLRRGNRRCNAVMSLSAHQSGRHNACVHADPLCTIAGAAELPGLELAQLVVKTLPELTDAGTCCLLAHLCRGWLGGDPYVTTFSERHMHAGLSQVSVPYTEVHARVLRRGQHAIIRRHSCLPLPCHPCCGAGSQQAVQQLVDAAVQQDAFLKALAGGIVKQEKAKLRPHVRCGFAHCPPTLAVVHSMRKTTPAVRHAPSFDAMHCIVLRACTLKAVGAAATCMH